MQVGRTEAASGFTVSVASVSGNNGTTISVPVSFSNVPSNGICAADMTINYDASKLEYVSGEAGSIVTNPTVNFGINKETNGKLRVLFLDNTMSNGYISQNGVFTNLTFKVLNSGSTNVSVSDATFGDKNLTSVSATLSAGSINGGGITTPVATPTKTQTVVTPTRTVANTPVVGSGFTVSVESVSARTGTTIAVPVNFASVPSSGICAADMTITYDASKLEYVSGEAGSIVTNPEVNFGINKEENGKLRVLFLDNTMSNGYISQNGLFVRITFKALNSGAATVSLKDATFGDKSLANVSAKLNAGTITITGDTVQTSVVTPTKTQTVVTPTKTPANTPVVGSGFTVSVDSASANNGATFVLPVYFANVPSSGICAADMTIIYDSSKLEYISGQAGSIVTIPDVNFGINKETNGKLRVLFLDNTMSNGYISQNGVFVNLTFKALSSGAVTVSLSDATFGDKTLANVSTKLNSGTVTIGGGNVQTPVVTPGKTPQASSTNTQPTPTSGPQSSGSFSVTYSENSWGTGATVNLTIKNNGSSAVEGWSIKFNYSGDQKITNAWNCKYSQSGTTVTITNEIYNASLPAGGSVTVGFNISYSGTNTAPTEFTVNSSSVNTGTQTPVATPTKTQTVVTPTYTQVVVTPANTPVVGSGFTVSVDSASANNGSTIVVPVSFANVPSSGICAADMTINYDASKLEYISGEAGSIVTNPEVNFGINKESNGKLKVLFLDNTMSNGYISQNGVFAKLTFRAISSGNATISLSDATFGDKSLANVSAKLNAGTITIGGGTVQTPVATPTKTQTVVTPTNTQTVVTPVKTPVVGSGFTVSVDSVSANNGTTFVVPVYFANVPSNGICAADMTINYDSNKLEYISGEAGSIVTNPEVNFGINKETNGKLRVLFLDNTMSNGYISQNGVFVKLTFKVIANEKVSTVVSMNDATFGDKTLANVSATLTSGKIDLNGGGAVSTPVTTAQPTSTPIPQTSGSLSASYSENSWGTGATVSMTIKNNGTTAVEGWTVNFNYSGDQKITNAWNCKYSQSGTSVTITNEAYNASIPAGGSVTLGFNISYTGTNTPPTVFSAK